VTSSEEAQALLAGAGKRLDYARTSLEAEMFAPATSLAYYAVFYAAQAVIAYHRQAAKTHRGGSKPILEIGGRRFRLPTEVAGIINTLEPGRLEADYTALVEISPPDAAQAITQTQTFVTEVTTWFQRHHPSKKG